MSSQRKRTLLKVIILGDSGYVPGCPLVLCAAGVWPQWSLCCVARVRC